MILSELLFSKLCHNLCKSTYLYIYLIKKMIYFHFYSMLNVKNIHQIIQFALVSSNVYMV